MLAVGVGEVLGEGVGVAFGDGVAVALGVGVSTTTAAVGQPNGTEGTEMVGVGDG